MEYINRQSQAGRGSRLLLLNFVMAACLSIMLGPQIVQGQEPAVTQDQFASQLSVLVDEGESRGWQVDALESLVVKQDPYRQIIYLPSNANSMWEQPTTDTEEQAWRARVDQLRSSYADTLLNHARSLAADGDGDQAYQRLHQILVVNPQHKEVRIMLGFKLHHSLGWVRSTRPTNATNARTRHRTFGWDRGTYWVIKSPHFEIVSGAGEQAGLQLAEELERTYWTWRQVFFDYWAGVDELNDWLAGSSKDRTTTKKHKVILFRDRDQYINELSERVKGAIAISTGYYDDKAKLSLFYHSEADPQIATWRHEIVHQLLQENAGARPIADRGHAWLVEGLAMYFESMRTSQHHVTLGGFDSARLQLARLRKKRQGFYEPMQQLDALNRQQLVEDSTLAPRRYTQAAGVTQFLFTSEDGRYRDGLIQFTKQLYKNRREGANLTEHTLAFDQMDRAYDQFLNFDRESFLSYFQFTDPDGLSLSHSQLQASDLQALNDCPNLQWLELSGNPVDNSVMDYLANATELIQLHLDKSRVDSAIGPALSKLSKLEELDLATTKFQDDGIRHLESLPNLQVLWLAGSQVSDSCIDSLIKMPALVKVDLRETQVTQAGIDKLKQAKPRLSVSF